MKIRARRMGRVTHTLTILAEAFRSGSPDKDCRWVYDPVHKPELSGVMGRMAQGYRKVLGRDLQNSDLLESAGLKEDEPVRLADTVLMAISKEVRAELREEIEDTIKAQISSIDRSFYDAIRSINEGMEAKHRPRPVGRSVIEEREFEFDYVQRTGDDDEGAGSAQ